MTRTAKEELFQQVLAIDTFNGRDNTILEEKAGLALRNIPKRIDRELLRATLLRFAEESPGYFWFALPKTKREHLDVVLSVVDQCARTETPDGLQGRFVSAAIDSDASADCRFEQFSRAAVLVGYASRLDQATGEVGRCPVTVKDGAALSPFVEDERIAAAACTALAASNGKHDVHTRGLFWNLVGLLGLAGDERSISALEALTDQFVRGDDWDLQLLCYALDRRGR